VGHRRDSGVHHSFGLITAWHDKAEWKAFFVVAPDGLLRWFRERLPDVEYPMTLKYQSPS